MIYQNLLISNFHILYIRTNMKIDIHLKKANNLEKSIQKLDVHEDYETIVENSLLAASHTINAYLHKKEMLRLDRDIKHNNLASFLKEIDLKNTKRLKFLIRSLEELRPRHVYGTGRNGEVAKLALSYLREVKEICLPEIQ